MRGLSRRTLRTLIGYDGLIPDTEVALFSRIDPHVFSSRFLMELRSVRNDTQLTVIPSGSEESPFNFGIRPNMFGRKKQHVLRSPLLYKKGWHVPGGGGIL
jgi:hypothetical protein